MDHDLPLQKLPSVDERPGTAERSHEFYPPCDWLEQFESLPLTQSESRVKRKSYRSRPVTEPPGCERSECKGLEAVKDETRSFKH